MRFFLSEAPPPPLGAAASQPHSLTKWKNGRQGLLGCRQLFPLTGCMFSPPRGITFHRPSFGTVVPRPSRADMPWAALGVPEGCVKADGPFGVRPACVWACTHSHWRCSQVWSVETLIRQDLTSREGPGKKCFCWLTCWPPHPRDFPRTNGSQKC